MNFKAALFDLDGTLLYTLEDLAESMNEALTRAGLPVHATETYRYFVGNGVRMLVRRAVPEDWGTPDRLDRVLKDFSTVYASRQTLKTRPYPGIPETLKSLAGAGVILAVLSNKPHRNTLEVIEAYFPGLFTAVLGLKPQAAPKPDPGGALGLARELGLAPGEFVYLGDSDVDMRTAQAAGMWPVGASWGYRTAEELLGAGAARVIETPEELTALFAGARIGS